MNETIDFRVYPLPKVAKCKINIDLSQQKRILVAGEGSYIGQSFVEYLRQFTNYQINTVKTLDSEWKRISFSKYDVVYDVAGIAHIKETAENEYLYYEVNRDLAVELARKAKAEGVKQFIYLSSMSVYGLTVGSIHKDTPVNPINAYGKSKLEAEKLLWQLNDESFKIAIVRPPMVYGEGCKGNYQTLRKFALKVGFFPEYENERSMIYIDNLSAAIRGIVHNDESGLYFPQDLEYVKVFDMVKGIAESSGKKFHGTKLVNVPIKLLAKKINLFRKVFGTLVYDKSMNVPREWIITNTKDSSVITEDGIKAQKKGEKVTSYEEHIYFEKKNGSIRFSIVIPCFNNHQYLEDCLISVLHQTFDDIEIIVVDDHSKTFDINGVVSFIEENKNDNISKVVVYQNPQNYGTVKSLNEAIKERITGDYIKIVAADDALYNDSVLEDVAKNFQASSSEVHVYDVMKCDSDMKEIRVYRNGFLDTINSSSSFENFKKLCVRNKIYATGVFFKKEFFATYGYFDEKYRLLEDWPTWLRYLLSGGNFKYFRRISTKYRTNAGVVANCNSLFLEDRRKVFYEIIKPEKRRIKITLYYKAMIAANVISSVPLRKAYIRLSSLFK